eukprot:1141817-Pelagomonas_calceolata.AAC.4
MILPPCKPKLLLWAQLTCIRPYSWRWPISADCWVALVASPTKKEGDQSLQERKAKECGSGTYRGEGN